MVNLDRIYKSSKLLKIDCIKKEVEEFIKGFTIKNIKLNNGTWECSFENENGESLNLTIATASDTIMMSKQKGNFVESIKIDDNLLMVHEIIEKRPNGIIYSIINKQFALSKCFKNEFVLVDLVEQRFIFSKKCLESLIDNFDFNNTRLNSYFLKLRMLGNNLECDYFTEFSTHMNNYATLMDGRKIRDNIYPTRTYLNGDELSAVFDVNDGEDKLYRVYDLYHGIINPRNENDIYAINLGLLTPDSYDLKTLKGITEREDNIVGKSLDTEDENYLKYLKELLNRKVGFKGTLTLTRDSILTGITYRMSSSEITRRVIERELGISYDEFDKMDYDEQHKLIEKITGREIQIDDRRYIDGIPMDEDHIMTMEQADRRIDEITATGPKKLIRKLIKPFHKK